MQGDDDKVPTNTNHVSLLIIIDLRGYVAGRLDNMGRSAITLRWPKSIPNNQYQQRFLHFETKRAKLKAVTIQHQWAEGLEWEKPQDLQSLHRKVTRH